MVGAILDLCEVMLHLSSPHRHSMGARSIQACVKKLGSPIQACVKKFRSFDSSHILNRSTQAGVQKTTKARKVPLYGPLAVPGIIDSTTRRIRSTVLSVLRENDPEALGALDCNRQVSLELIQLLI
jgi:hypothetical protein